MELRINMDIFGTGITVFAWRNFLIQTWLMQLPSILEIRRCSWPPAMTMTSRSGAVERQYKLWGSMKILLDEEWRYERGVGITEVIAVLTDQRMKIVERMPGAGCSSRLFKDAVTFYDVFEKYTQIHCLHFSDFPRIARHLLSSSIPICYFFKDRMVIHPKLLIWLSGKNIVFP